LATLRDIRRRIVSVKSTQQITKAMKMVAAAKLRRAQESLLRSRPYADRLSDVVGHLASKVDRNLHPLLAEREPRRICYVVITADRGLCGSFNSNVIRSAKAAIESHPEEQEVKLITLGRKGFEHFSKRGYDILESYVKFFNNLQFEHALDVASLIRQQYREASLDRVFLVYNEFVSSVRQRVVVEQLLPILPKQPEEERFEADYLFEPSAGAILEELCPRYLNIRVWHALLESYAAEQGARMAAMEAATDNAAEMIYQLTLYYNKVRQANITKEIAEIVGGAEALKR
jgi:F-type H+-transporting ATPase subunit gamma